MTPGDGDQNSISMKPAVWTYMELFVKYLISRNSFCGFKSQYACYPDLLTEWLGKDCTPSTKFWVWVDCSLGTAMWNVKNIGTEVWHFLKFWALVEPGISRNLHIFFFLFPFFNKLFSKWCRPNFIAGPIFKKISIREIRLVGLENKTFSSKLFILFSVV